MKGEGDGQVWTSVTVELFGKSCKGYLDHVRRNQTTAITALLTHRESSRLLFISLLSSAVVSSEIATVIALTILIPILISLLLIMIIIK